MGDVRMRIFTLVLFFTGGLAMAGESETVDLLRAVTWNASAPSSSSLVMPILRSTMVTFLDTSGKEVLRIGSDGFWVRGVKLEQDEQEARSVFEAIHGWLKSMGRLP